jgi:hypothetical protein
MTIRHALVAAGIGAGITAIGALCGKWSVTVALVLLFPGIAVWSATGGVHGAFGNSSSFLLVANAISWFLAALPIVKWIAKRRTAMSAVSSAGRVDSSQGGS